MAITGDKIFFLVYTSRAIGPIGEPFLFPILEVSRRNNSRDKITGFLSARAEHFFQLLEGPEEKVRQCFARIRSDKRHRLITIQGEGRMEQRLMASWSMAWLEFPEGKTPDKGILELFELARAGKPLSNPGAAIAMLKIFARDARPVG